MLPCVLLLMSLPIHAEPAGPTVVGAKAPLPPLVRALTAPKSVAIGPDGRTYVSVAGKRDRQGDGAIVVIQGDKAVPFATGLDDPSGMVASGPHLYVTDRTRVVRIDGKGKVEAYVEGKAFPKPPRRLTDIESDGKGSLYVSDAGDREGGKGKVFVINPAKKVRLLIDADTNPALKAPGGLRQISEHHLHLLDAAYGSLSRVRLSDGRIEKLAAGVGGDGIALDSHGRIYLSDSSGGKVHVLARAGERPVVLASGFASAAAPCLSADGKSVLVPDRKAGAIYAVPAMVPGAAVDESPLPVRIVPAFADLKWTGWKGVSESGKLEPQRPIVLTHAGDGSGRVFVATQHGVVHSFANTPKAQATKVFLDIRDRVKYLDSENEEGFLGMAFHPAFKKTGELFVYYTPRDRKLTNVVSRFRVSKNDPDRADPATEEVLLELPKPFWNHNGGTVAFGPDGHLYIAVGDGGSANDPFGNGQKLSTPLGKILRIDVNRKADGKPYAIPGDNPFARRPTARPEIWAYGLRNVWRMAFDAKTGALWAADVGQNLWEEINLIQRGGNYGWRPREGLHPFGNDGVGPNKEMIDPIWEYHHGIGKSITGGMVYRGTRVPALQGLYLYADYVSGHVWGLRYDEKAKRVTANHRLRQGGFPVLSFGEDERGEVYLLTSTPNGKGLFTFAPAHKPQP